MIKEFEFYHGAVFARLIHGAANSICFKPYSSFGNASYIINSEVGVYIKHSAKRLSPWHFSFQKIHLNEIQQMKNAFKKVFLIMICGEDGFVTLDFKELKILLNEKSEDDKWISATRNRRKEYSIKGSDGKLGYKIGKSDFLKRILEL